MSDASRRRAEEFLAIADQFKLGVLTTEASHPVTTNLSETARASVEDGLELLFRVDDDVLAKYREWVASGAVESIASDVWTAACSGRRVFFTGCGSTGRLSILLDSIWRDFWHRWGEEYPDHAEQAAEMAVLSRSAMAGGDFALIKSVEGFEDFTQFGRRQMADLGIGEGDVLFAITEGGETSWVIGTAWEALDRGATVYFVYNNPDDVLCEHVERSRKIIEEPHITKINLTTGPMAITGSTRMQATTIELLVLLTVLERALRLLSWEINPDDLVMNDDAAAEEHLAEVEMLFGSLRSPRLRRELAELVRLEEETYRAGHRTTYFADRLAVDMLTDTTERSPTFCTPPFRRCDDAEAAESWAFLCVPQKTTEDAWPALLKREPCPIDWSDEVVRSLVPPERAERTIQIVRKIGLKDLMKFRIGQDGLRLRRLGTGDCAVGLVGPGENDLLAHGFVRDRLMSAGTAGARLAVIKVGPLDETAWAREIVDGWHRPVLFVGLHTPRTGLLLDGATRAGVKMLLNALSTCTMVRLGRVMGNTMIWVVASNLKLIDRSTRYIFRLTGLPYDDACRLLFESIEYVTPRMVADKAYPPVVGLSVVRARDGLSPEAAEERLWRELGR